MEVKICADKVKEISEILSKNKLDYHKWDEPYFPDINNVEQLAQFYFVGNSINFKFWNTSCKDRYTFGGFSGSAAMWAFLSNNLRLVDPVHIKSLEIINEVELQQMPMHLERVSALREAGTQLLRCFNGSALNLCEYGNWHGPTIVQAITDYFPTWRDEQRNVKFNKRAQLFITMLHGRLGEYSRFTGMDQLTCLADYQLPKVLRHLGIIQYSKKLEDIIDSEQLILEGSDDEFSIRVSTLDAVKQLCEELSTRNINVNPAQLDYLLWKSSRNIDSPHHLTITTAY